jgi:hypothetical protein
MKPRTREAALGGREDLGAPVGLKLNVGSPQDGYLMSF